MSTLYINVIGKKAGSCSMLYFFACFLLLSCSKKTNPTPPKLPDITQEGKNTFGCYVDGTLWLPTNRFELYPTRLCVRYDDTQRLNITCWRDNTITGKRGNDIIEINIQNITGTGTYDLTNAARVSCYIRLGNETSPLSVPTVTKGALTITRFDRAKNIVSGQFAFTIKNNDTNVIHEATEGRFDLQFDFCM
ncbi:DUF6252 family protein [Mucilaginibacter sp.]|uniref:DUF6252 family protein n=1 Tax=Mucilaginibacter sp. TaxID=1882438 RepID=UPI003AFFAF35